MYTHTTHTTHAHTHNTHTTHTTRVHTHGHTQMTATSAFTTTTVEVPASLTNLTTYNAIVNKLNKLWDDQMTAVQQVTDVSQE